MAQQPSVAVAICVVVFATLNYAWTPAARVASEHFEFRGDGGTPDATRWNDTRRVAEPKLNLVCLKEHSLA